MEKVNEIDNNSKIWKCKRCLQNYCSHCVEEHNVDFEVIDDSSAYNSIEQQWKGIDVCCFCYNQLMDKACKKFIKSSESKDKKISKSDKK